MVRYLMIGLLPVLAACGDKGLTGDVRYNFINSSYIACKAELSRTEFSDPVTNDAFCSCQSASAADQLTNNQVIDAEATTNASAVAAIAKTISKAGTENCMQHLTKG